MIDMTDFNKLTAEEKLACAADWIAFWRTIQRDLSRIEIAETPEEKTAVDAKIAAADPAAIEDKYKPKSIEEGAGK